MCSVIKLYLTHLNQHRITFSLRPSVFYEYYREIASLMCVVCEAITLSNSTAEIYV